VTSIGHGAVVDVHAFFQNILWDVVNRRQERGKAAAALR
jgi:hypothetical protein